MSGNIKELVRLALADAQRLGYSATTLSEMKLDLDGLVHLHQHYGESDITQTIVDEYLHSAEVLYNSKLFCKERYYKRLRSVERIVLYDKTRDWSNFQVRPRATISPYYDDLVKVTLANDSRSEETRRSMKFALLNHFSWLNNQGIETLAHVTAQLLMQYIEFAMDRYAPSTVRAFKGNLKRAYSFYVETGVATDNFVGVLSLSIYGRKKSADPIPTTEIASTLQVIDRSRPVGKRDYAMILLATVTGLRAVDVAGIKLSDIDWVKGELRVTQSKTGNILLLPLTTDVGEALQEYILEARPKHGEEEVFLRFHPPFRKLHSGGIAAAHNRWRQAAGLSKRGFHSLRRSLGREMVQAGVAIEKVAQVFGSRLEESLNPYISLDEINLKKCALGFTGIEVTGQFA